MQIEHATAKVLNEEKEKTSFNLCKTTIRNLDECWMEMRKLYGSRKITRTLLMEVAFLVAFCDFQNNKKDSDFYKDVISMLEEEEK